MADTVFESITKNIETTLSGLALTYTNGETRTLLCDRERFVDIIGNRCPLALISGPNVEVVQRAHRVAHCELSYQIMVIDNSINDEYDPDTPVDPVTEVMSNVGGDVIKQLMADHTRGGYARDTRFEAFGHYFDSDGKFSYFIEYILITVTAFVRDTDPYYTGG